MNSLSSCKALQIINTCKIHFNGTDLQSVRATHHTNRKGIEIKSKPRCLFQTVVTADMLFSLQEVDAHFWADPRPFIQHLNVFRDCTFTTTRVRQLYFFPRCTDRPVCSEPPSLSGPLPNAGPCQTNKSGKWITKPSKRGFNCFS